MQPNVLSTHPQSTQSWQQHPAEMRRNSWLNLIPIIVRKNFRIPFACLQQCQDLILCNVALPAAFMHPFAQCFKQFLIIPEYIADWLEKTVNETEDKEPDTMTYVAVLAKFSYLYQKYDVRMQRNVFSTHPQSTQSWQQHPAEMRRNSWL